MGLTRRSPYRSTESAQLRHFPLPTLERRLAALSGPALQRGSTLVPEDFTAAFGGGRSLSLAFEDPEALAQAEEAVISAATMDKQGEIQAVQAVLAQLRAAVEVGGEPAKWLVAQSLMSQHGIRPRNDQLLVFSEFADTARCLAAKFADVGFSVETLEGAVDHRARHDLQRRFLAQDFQVLVSTDAGGEGINLQSANVMIDWDIPWSLVRLEQRMGRLHRIARDERCEPGRLQKKPTPLTRIAGWWPGAEPDR